MQRIMGIDPGTISCGYAVLAVLQRHQLQAHCAGVIRMSSRDTLSKRYRALFQAITEIVSEVKPDAVVLETQYMHKNPSSTIKLGMARGVLILAASLQEIPIFEYTPNQAKKSAVGNGRASKRQVQVMISKVLNLPDLVSPNNADIADAFALAICHAYSHK